MNRIVFVLVVAVLAAACSREEARPARSLATKDPMMEVKERLAGNPRDADAWFRLADLYERAGMYAEEVDALKKVVEITPGAGYPYVKLGTAYNRLAKYADAVASFRKALKSQAANPVLHNNLAFSYGKLGKTDEEIASLKQALAIRPRYATARYNLGMAYLKKGMRQEALQQYDALMQIDEGAAASLKREIHAKTK